MKYYAGIGSRETPTNVMNLMRKIGADMAEKGYCLRSGGARGADKAFEDGCDIVQGAKQIIIPYETFNGYEHDGQSVIAGKSIMAYYEKAWGIASTLVSNFEEQKEFTQEAHTRNVMQVLGRRLDKPVDMVICYCIMKNGKPTGGTRTAYKLAKRKGIEVWNLYEPKDYDAWAAKFERKREKIDWFK